METTKDEEINKILARAEKYREKYNEKSSTEKNVKFEIDTDISNIFKAFFKTQLGHNYNDKNNIFINCKLNQNEIRITPGFYLQKEIIHIYAPIFSQEKEPIEKLKECYLKLFEKLIEEKYNSVIIPSLATGFHRL